MTQPIPFYLVDAFTSKKFAGNPAGVCLLEEQLPANLMQQIAAEINQAETAFLHRAHGHYNIRWFTPVKEVNLCGHATLASAHVLRKLENDCTEKVTFQSKSGPLRLSFDPNSIEMDFPALPLREQETPEGLLEILGIKPIASFWAKDRYLLEVTSKDELLNMTPNFQAWKGFPNVIVTCKSDDEAYDFYSRFFAPAAGIIEDPVTGSAHCALGPYWQNKLGKNNFKAYQLSARGGGMSLRVAGDRVFMKGNAQLVVQGQLFV